MAGTDRREETEGPGRRGQEQEERAGEAAAGSRCVSRREARAGNVPMKLPGWSTVVLLMASSLAWAQAPREVAIITGRGELLQFERDIERVAISEPKIADAIVVSPREIMVNGKGAGKATL